MSIEDEKQQVSGHLEAFRRTGELKDLRTAANSIETIDAQPTSFESRQAYRALKLELWMTLLDTIDSAKDPQFNPADVPAMRVLVPSGTPMGPGVPIVSPEGIANPEDRRKYDEAVKANEDKTRKYRIQKELRQLDAELTSRCDSYIAGNVLKSPQGVRKMEEAIERNIHSQGRAAHLRSLVQP